MATNTDALYLPIEGFIKVSLKDIPKAINGRDAAANM
jgi:hypothetical protein